MASCSFNSTGRTFTLEVVETSYSVASNTSNIRWTLSISGGGSTWYNSYVKATVNGSVVYNETRNWSSGIFPAKDGSVSGTITGISHDSQGYKSISFAVEGYSEVYSTQYANGSLTLTAIPRKANITSAPNFNDEANPSIGYSNPAGNNVSLLQACISLTGSRDDISYRDIPKTGSSYTFNLTESERNILRNACTNSNTLSVIFFVRTEIAGNTYYSTLNRTMSIVNGNPVFPASGVSYEDTNDDVVEITEDNQMIVRNNSNLEVTFETATALKNASISRYEVIFNGQTRTLTSAGTVDLGIVNLSQDSTLVVKAVDSRGNSTSVSKTVKIYDWVNPTATITAGRVNNYEDDTKLKVSTTISYVDNKNEVKSIVYRYKKTSDDNYSQDFPLSDNIEATVIIDKLYAWDFQVVITDCFGSTRYNFTVTRGTPIMFIDVNKLSVGINSFPDSQKQLSIIGDQKIDGSIVAELKAPYNYTSDDLVKIRNYIQKFDTLTEDEIEKYDINKDGVVNAVDYVVIKKLIDNGIDTTHSAKLKMQKGMDVSNLAFVWEDANNNEIAKIGLEGMFYKDVPVNNACSYSTNEIVVGRWINNKPLYRKVINTNELVANDKTIAHHIDNVDLIYISKIFLINTNANITWTVPTDLYGTGGTTNVDRMNTYVTKTDIGFKCDTTWPDYWTKVIVLEYTKTTD